MSALSANHSSAPVPDWSVLVRPALGFVLSNAALLAIMLAFTTV